LPGCVSCPSVIIFVSAAASAAGTLGIVTSAVPGAFVAGLSATDSFGFALGNVVSFQGKFISPSGRGHGRPDPDGAVQHKSEKLQYYELAELI
jgi:hypothetical protein